MITANASQRECQKHWNKLHFRVLERNNNKFIWSKLFLVSVFLHVLTWIPTCSELFITFVTVFSLNSIFNDINFEFFIFNEVSPPEDPRMGCKGAPPRVNLSKDCCIIRDWCSRVRPTQERSFNFWDNILLPTSFHSIKSHDHSKCFSMRMTKTLK